VEEVDFYVNFDFFVPAADITEILFRQFDDVEDNDDDVVDDTWQRLFNFDFGNPPFIPDITEIIGWPSYDDDLVSDDDDNLNENDEPWTFYAYPAPMSTGFEWIIRARRRGRR